MLEENPNRILFTSLWKIINHRCFLFVVMRICLTANNCVSAQAHVDLYSTPTYAACEAAGEAVSHLLWPCGVLFYFARYFLYHLTSF